jgi:hypothetical protein
MCTTPILMQPDFNKKFYLQMDASGYGMGAILLQEGDPETLTPALVKKHTPVLHPIVYYLATFTPTEQNYNIYDCELLAIMKALAHWRQYLGWTKVPLWSWQTMPTFNIGNCCKILYGMWHDGMWTYRNTTTKSNMYQGRRMDHQTHCHSNLAWTRGRRIIKGWW